MHALTIFSLSPFSAITSLTSIDPSAYSLHPFQVIAMYAKIFTNNFFIDCYIWFIQIYFIARIFFAFDGAPLLLIKGHRMENRSWGRDRGRARGEKGWCLKCKRKAAINMQIKRCKKAINDAYFWAVDSSSHKERMSSTAMGSK